MHHLSFRFPLDLEVGFGVKERIFVPGQDFEEAAGADLSAGVFEIFLVIGHEEKLAVGPQGGFDGPEERDLNDAAPVMLHFGPWIRAKEMDA